jgi:xanthine dehydrogenase YagR molybdenum-binding subunit
MPDDGANTPGGRLLVEGDVPPELGRSLDVVGTAINRRDGVEKVTGRAQYSSDIHLPGMLYAQVLRSPHAHARITRIDVTAAEALPGVAAIIHKDNCTGWQTYWYMKPQPAFPEEIAYAGQEVAVVAAEDIDTARRAVALIDIEYEVLPAVVTTADALRPGAPVVPTLDVAEGRDGNRQRPSFRWEQGDVERGLAEADVVLDGTYTLPTQFHVDIQTRCCVADYDGERLVVYEAAQGVWNVKLQLARSLGLPEDRVRVVVSYMGGGFGSKAGAQRIIHYVARLAMLTRRPVRLELSRPEEFVSHPRRYGATVRLRLGAMRDGRLTAIHGQAVFDIGSGSLFSGTKYTKVLHHMCELYRCPNVRVEIEAVYTNTPPTGPTRGVMDPIGTYSTESAIDDLADALGMDPLALRRQNYAHYADAAQTIPYSSKRLDQCMDRVAEAIGWHRRAQVTEANRTRIRKRGIGMACYCIERGGLAPYTAKAEVVLTPDGTIELRAGVVEIGSGQITILPMIAAEELGVEAADIRLVWGDTEGTLYAPSSHASRITAEMGPATLQAAAQARRELLDLVGSRFGVPGTTLTSRRGAIHTREGRPLLSVREACGLIPGPDIRAVGSRAPNPESPAFRSFGAQAVEVEVDLESGDLRVLRVVSSHDIGRAVNPKLVESQHYGGIVMGLGYGLYEEAEIDGKTGVLLNCDVHQYRVPTALETPAIETFDVEGPDPYYAYSAKPVGEAPLVALMPAVRNALYHACGVRISELPITPAKILAAVRPRG